MSRRPLVAGNWKMHGLTSSTSELEAIVAGAAEISGVDVLICPPATLVARFAGEARGSAVAIGGQDCHAELSGAFTGDISAEMLKDAGASAVIVGHSERRQYHGETDHDVRAKAMAAARVGLMPIVCVGETRAERDAGKAHTLVGRQIEGSLPEQPGDAVVAYEPVWAIGTGLMASAADVADMHEFIRRRLITRYGAAGEAVRILYGGSVKPANAAELAAVDNVDGALVGGASLKAVDFLAIARAYG
jgi:triosephosphate isomerase